jgi:hypothetical protein
MVELQNGMITDVYYNEEHDFITITSEVDLIEYLNSQEITPIEFYFRNGVFALRQTDVEDTERLELWRIKDSIKVTDSIPLKNAQIKECMLIPKFMLATFYWIEIGTFKITHTKDGAKITLDVYEKKYLENSIQKGLLTKFDIDLFLDLIREHLELKLLEF